MLVVSASRPLCSFFVVSGSSGLFYQHEKAAIPTHGKVFLYFSLGCLDNKFGNTHVYTDPNQTHFSVDHQFRDKYTAFSLSGTNTPRHNSEVYSQLLAALERQRARVFPPWDIFPLGLIQTQKFYREQ